MGSGRRKGHFTPGQLAEGASRTRSAEIPSRFMVVDALIWIPGRQSALADFRRLDPYFSAGRRGRNRIMLEMTINPRPRVREEDDRGAETIGFSIDGTWV